MGARTVVLNKNMVLGSEWKRGSASGQALFVTGSCQRYRSAWPRAVKTP